jgi:hypothetical protein
MLCFHPTAPRLRDGEIQIMEVLLRMSIRRDAQHHARVFRHPAVDIREVEAFGLGADLQGDMAAAIIRAMSTAMSTS